MGRGREISGQWKQRWIISLGCSSWSADSPEPLPVQPPASHPLSPFSDAPPPPPPTSPPPALFTTGAPSQMSPCLSAGGPLILAWGLMGALGNRPSRTRQERRLPVFVRPEDWDCPWCKSEFFRGQVVSTMHLAAEYSSEFRNVKQQEYIQRGKGGRGAGWCEVR